MTVDGGAAKTTAIDIADRASVEALCLDDADVTVVLDRSSTLIRSCCLPAAAESDFRALLGHELERVSPFSLNQIHYDYEIESRNTETNTVRLTVGIVLRTTLAKLLDRLEQLGIRPDTATTTGGNREPLAMNWLIRPATLRMPFAHGPIRPLTAALVGLTLIVALFGPLIRYQSLDERYRESADGAREAATALRDETLRLSADIERAAFLDELQETYISPLDVLADLTEALPDSAWLSRVGLSSQGVQLDGEAIGASGLLERLAAIETLTEAEFRSPVSMNASTRKESFSIASTFASAGGAP